MSRLLAYVENDNALWIVGLRDSLDAYITNATVSCTGITKDGAAVSAGSFPVSCAYQSGTTVGEHDDGNYLGIIPDEVELEADAEYVATVTVTSGDGNAKFSVPFTARTRTTL